MRHLFLLVLLVWSINTVSAAAVDEATAARDTLADSFAQLLIKLKPAITASLDQEDHDLANQLEFDFDRTDLGISPEARIENGHRSIHFPMGFVFVLDAFSRSSSESLLNEKLKDNVGYWLFSFDDHVSQVRSERPITLALYYKQIFNMPSICKTVINDQSYCKSFLTDKQSPLYRTYWDDYSGIAVAATIMVIGRELSHHLRGHVQGSANQDVAGSDEEKAADQKGAEVYFALRQDPLTNIFPFSLSVIVNDPGDRSGRRIRDPSLWCRSVAMNDTIMNLYLTNREASNDLQSEGKLELVQNAYQKFHAERKSRCSNR